MRKAPLFGFPGFRSRIATSVPRAAMVVLSPAMVLLILHAAYLAMYTAYCKKMKMLRIELFLDVLLFRQGLEHTLKEVNKVVSLAALTALLPSALLASCSDGPSRDWSYQMLIYCLALLAMHSTYSSVKYYGSKNIPYLSTWSSSNSAANPAACLVGFFTKTSQEFSGSAKSSVVAARKVSTLCGIFGLVFLLALAAASTIAPAALAVAASALSVGHFYLMEIDYKWVVKARPFGKLPFPLAALCALGWVYVGVQAYLR